MTSALSALFGVFLKTLFEALAGAFLAKKADDDRSAVTREAGALAAANETKDVINEVAQKQAALNARPTDVLDIAAGLRREAAAATGGDGPAVTGDPLGR
ncbi:MAG: hypothetical protein Q8M31_18470 [Beijerinckiaceae bacterium]|nr:hypothetical protein [Beijerinckiaceae bacterium]